MMRRPRTVRCGRSPAVEVMLRRAMPMTVAAVRERRETRASVAHAPTTEREVTWTKVWFASCAACSSRYTRGSLILSSRTSPTHSGAESGATQAGTAGSGSSGSSGRTDVKSHSPAASRARGGTHAAESRPVTAQESRMRARLEGLQHLQQLLIITLLS